MGGGTQTSLEPSTPRKCHNIVTLRSALFAFVAQRQADQRFLFEVVGLG